MRLYLHINIVIEEDYFLARTLQHSLRLLTLPLTRLSKLDYVSYSLPVTTAVPIILNEMDTDIDTLTKHTPARHPNLLVKPQPAVIAA